MARERADRVLCQQGLARTRSRARDLIQRGRVTVDGKPLRRPGTLLPSDAVIAIAPGPGFVSRGGEKLDDALDALAVDVTGAVVVDIGASTGGFTDCVLQRGARKVYAVDVGHGQLHPTLRADARIVVREGANARHLAPSDFDDPIDIVLVDASFIGLEKLLPAVTRILPMGGRLIALVKPQFEVGKDIARRARGVIRDGTERARAIADAHAAIAAAGLHVIGACDSALPGPKGNVEHFVHAERVATGSSSAAPRG